MLIRWAWHNLAIGDAFLVTVAVIIVVMALACMFAYYFRMAKLRVFLYRASIALNNAAKYFDFLTGDEDDEIPMPKEYVDWASAKLWRDTCIRPHQRRM